MLFPFFFLTICSFCGLLGILVASVFELLGSGLIGPVFSKLAVLQWRYGF